MMKLYYMLWVDAIVKLRMQPKNVDLWKFYAMVFMSMSQIFNIMFITALIPKKILNLSWYRLDIDLFPGENMDALTSFIILYLFPVVLFNYFFIFYKNKYEFLIKKYKSYGGRLFVPYFLCSLFIPIISLIIGVLLVKIGIIN